MNGETTVMKNLGGYLALEIHQAEEGGKYRLIRLKGRLDTNNTVAFNTALEEIVQSTGNLIFDLEGLDYISSTGIGSFVHIFKELTGKSGLIIFVQISEKVKNAFELLGFDTFIPMKENLEGALELVNSRGSGMVVEFPLKVICPACGKALKIPKSGSFRCPACKDVFAVEASGKIIHVPKK